MLEKHLALSSDYYYWNKVEHNILLGKWCMKHKNKSHLYKYKHTIIRDIWDDEKYDSKVVYCRKLYNLILRPLSHTLNSIHNLDYNLRSWEIIVGWWLLFHIEISYDRYHLIKSALALNPDRCSILNLPAETFIPADSLEYTKFMYNDLRNIFILSFILTEFKNNDIEYCELNISNEDILDFEKLKSAKYHKNPTTSYQGLSFEYTFSGSRFRPSSIRNFLNEEGHEELPEYRYDFSPDSNLRGNLFIDFCPNNHFEKVCISLLKNQIPASFLETFKKIHNAVDVNYPTNKGVIYSANSFTTNDCFKIWTSSQINKNKSKLVLGQHSNTYGNLHIQSAEYYERRIADFFITWGWKEDKKTIPLPPLQLNPFFNKSHLIYLNSDKIIFADCSYSLFKNWYYSLPTGNDHFDTIQEVKTFYKSLDSSILKFFEHRLYPQNFGWDEEQILRSNFPELKLTNSNGEISFIDHMKSAKLCVLNYHSMILTECIAANFPIICFWDFNNTKIRQNVNYLYDNLQDVGILHSSPESAARFINENYQNIEIWWNDKNTIKAKRDYAFKFCKNEHEPEKSWANFLQSLLVTKKNDLIAV